MGRILTQNDSSRKGAEDVSFVQSQKRGREGGKEKTRESVHGIHCVVVGNERRHVTESARSQA